MELLLYQLRYQHSYCIQYETLATDIFLGLKVSPIVNRSNEAILFITRSTSEAVEARQKEIKVLSHVFIHGVRMFPTGPVGGCSSRCPWLC